MCACGLDFNSINTMTTHCKGCGEELTNLSPALSRYGHGDLCSDCGTMEAFHGDFIGRYASQVDDVLGITPLDLLQRDNITA